jgi:hypothetical protein
MRISQVARLKAPECRFSSSRDRDNIEACHSEPPHNSDPMSRMVKYLFGKFVDVRIYIQSCLFRSLVRGKMYK